MYGLLCTIGLRAVRDAVASADAAAFRAINLGLAARWLDPAMPAVTTLGEGWVQALIALVVLIVALAKRREDLRRMALAALVAYAGSGLISQAIKHLNDRPRPLLVLFDARHVGKPLFVGSFPSGHATTIFAAAFAWAAFLPKARWALYAVAVAVAISRVYLGVHFPLDVLYGAVLGAVTGIGSARLFRDRRTEDAK